MKLETLYLIVPPLIGLLVLWLLPKRALRYKPIPIMTENELEFFGRLCRAFPEGYIFPQVSMAALIKPDERERKRWGQAFAKIAQKRVDFALFDQDMVLLGIVELDDKTHDPEKDRERDALTQSAGIPTLRYHSKRKPSVARLAQDLKTLANL